MTPIPILRYQAGGDIYAQFQTQYGTQSADSIAAAAATGDRTQLNNAIANAKGNPAMDTSTLDALNGVLSNTFLSFLKNPAVLLALVIFGFFAMGGWGWAKRKLASK